MSRIKQKKQGVNNMLVFTNQDNNEGTITYNGSTFTFSAPSTFEGAQQINSVGSAAAPSFTFAGDIDTGLYWSAANVLGFATAGTARVTIPSTGGLVVAAATNGVLISGATTTGLNITGNATDAIKIQTGTFATGLNLGGTLTTGISVGTCTTGLTFTGTQTTHITSATTIVTNMPVPTVGAGFDTALGVKWIPYGKLSSTGMFVTEVYLDLHAAAVSSKNTDLDVIGEAAGGAAYIGQITAANHGTLVEMSITCVEVPATGDDDINFATSTAATAIYDDGAAGLAGYVLLHNHAGAWTLGETVHLATLPAANSYIYLTSGNGDTAGAYSAGKFLIKMYGV